MPADADKLGKPWSDDELDAIVSDYFQMLVAEIAGCSYIKSHHAKALMARIGRTHRSVEFKHQNLSAVLDELGMPWIPGYIPKRNYQQAIFGAVDRYLSSHPEAFDWMPRTAPVLSGDFFVETPTVKPSTAKVPSSLQRLVRKFDPIERDRKNRILGKAGEEFVVSVERQRLACAKRDDLAKKVRWVAVEDGDGAGYDVLSFTPEDGKQRLIEVKTTTGSARTPFFLTRNEVELSLERPDEWLIYRVHHFAQSPRIFRLFPPIDQAVRLVPESWRATF